MSGSKNYGTFTQWNTTQQKKEGTLTFCDSMDGTGEYYAKWNKPDGENHEILNQECFFYEKMGRSMNWNIYRTLCVTPECSLGKSCLCPNLRIPYMSSLSFSNFNRHSGPELW